MKFRVAEQRLLRRRLLEGERISKRWSRPISAGPEECNDVVEGNGRKNRRCGCCFGWNGEAGLARSGTGGFPGTSLRGCGKSDWPAPKAVGLLRQEQPQSKPWAASAPYFSHPGLHRLSNVSHTLKSLQLVPYRITCAIYPPTAFNPAQLLTRHSLWPRNRPVCWVIEITTHFDIGDEDTIGVVKGYSVRP